jgi:peptidoglycan/LPS O-acetylase OafA/YrhL
MTMIEAAVLMLSTLFVIYCGGKMQFLVAPVLFLFVVVFAFDGGAVSKFMSAHVFRYLAKISYSVYMTHVIISIVIAILAERVIGGAAPNWNPTGWGGDAVLLVYLAAVICFSHLTYHFVEVPGARFLRNFSLKRSEKKLTKPA